MKNVHNFFLVIILYFSSITFAFAVESNIQKMPSGTYALDKTHASLTWKISHLGLSNYTARFTNFDAQIELNSEKPSLSKVTANINPKSIATDYPYPEKKDFDAVLSDDKGWFNSNKFPEIEFKSTEIRLNDDGTGEMQGDLTLLGVTQAVALKVKFNGGILEHPFNMKPTIGFSAVGEILRSDWEMSKYIPTIGDSVSIHIEAEFVKQ